MTLVLLAACNPYKKGNKKYEVAEYDVAIDHYGRAIEKGKNVAASNYRIAESYRRSNRIKQAAPYYQAAIAAGLDLDEVHYHLGFSHKANANYEAAREQFELYAARGDNPDLLDRTRRELNNLDKLNTLITDESYWEVQNFQAINTDAAEYAPVFSNGFLYFTSSRGGGRVFKTTGTAFTNIYRAPMAGNNIDINGIEKLEESINSSNTNEGSVSFTRDGNTMVFAKGNSGRRKGMQDVNLYITRFRNNEWTEPELLSISDPGAWDSSPAFSRDDKTLYFASNREGGFGGIDLYSATVDANGRWGNVRNMGADINTAGDEMFPYVNYQGMLYFSSDGHPGLGMLDIFVAERKGGKIIIKNLGAPVNSSKDDFALSYRNRTEGYFSSNRDEGSGDDDIYTFVNNSPDLKIINYFLAGRTVTTTDEGEEHILNNVRVRLMNDEETVIQETTSNNKGEFQFRLDGDTDYIIIGEKPDYFTSRVLFTTVGKSLDPAELTEFETNVNFETKLNLDRIVLEKAIVLDNIYYDLDRADIRADAAQELDKLVDLLEDNPTIKIELSSHTDSRAPDDYNMDLSQRRAESAVNYIVSTGINPNRLTAKGYGETQLVNHCANDVECTEEEHQQNRRTEFKVLEVNEEEEESVEEEEKEGDGFGSEDLKGM